MRDLGLAPELLKKLDQMAIVCRRMKAGRSQGTRRSPKKGSSVEFADFRNYTRGDDLKRVDWNAYARLDRLFIKLFIEEQDVTLHVLVDESRSMRHDDAAKFTLGCQVAAALGYVALSNYDRAAAGFLTEGLDCYYGPVTGKPSWRGLWSFVGERMDALEAQAARAEQPAPPSLTDLDRALGQFASRRPVEGVTMVVSDLFCKGYQAGVRALQAAGQEVALLHVMSPQETAPGLSGELKLIDSETRSAREVSITPSLLRAYAQKVEAYSESVRQFCVSRGATYVRIRSDEPAGQFISSGLRAAGLVR
ncbi:MAG: DUF58 domain-containing protein [Bacillota bacterium]|nr:DUF58 domain-containing protein [Bacillota bacterium]